jgi:hypothetical protein
VLLCCRDPNAREERWRMFYGDVQIGSIGIRASEPVSANQPGLDLWLLPVLEPQPARASRRV